MTEQQQRPVMLVILDGWGWRDSNTDNAVRLAHTPVFDRLWGNGPHTFLSTSGEDVGLPEGQFGNSEVGHLNIGAGRVVMQDLPRITRAARDGSLGQNAVLRDLIAKARAGSGTIHLLGLISPGGVHAHQDHAVALAHILTEAGLTVLIHAVTDGRDTPPRSGVGFVAEFEAALPPGARIATLSGRYYAMDRDNRWERVKRAFDVIISGQGPHFGSAAEAIAAGYGEDLGDEFLLPAVIGGYEGVKPGDALLTFNFRADRTRQILMAMLDPAFDGFDRGPLPPFGAAAGLTQYSTALNAFQTTLFAPISMDDLLGQVVAQAGRRQLRMAETEKYPHVTYFLNGGIEVPNDGEERILVASPKVATYDLQPEMSAPELTAKAVEAIDSGRFDLIILNFANPDMVGHTGILEAAIRAVETVDTGLGEIVTAVTRQGGALFVTADHGNCELMRDQVTLVPHTAHTLNPVPAMLVGVPMGTTLASGRLGDIAPTLLALMGIAQPEAMTGVSLLRSATAATSA
ncbi:2,3-bisphosphoglycerate-independent phosphoglycerate mutase [Acidisoma cellulosilytica]|uniref:2,3-bisphosphoglycerate-independent phosphoglycerate mutase n=1 Tax=Acidisoma cellulosilyticum TaxID=2802395 RepID=A0A963YYZ2_9PROT|nr:2,3-bisphosphoglycerate-independent phosphoglycerate mutase [Acidisoma cellulosilyticum]MCB8878780.1 2,3-bisphosphoglycerate-independent phosphoglycerate mutase [Acidisoma cellulosilyticum]